MNYHYLPEPTPYNPESVIHIVLLTSICICVIAIPFLVRRIVEVEMDIKRINQEIEKRNTSCK